MVWFQVTVKEGRGETRHRVTLQKADYERLSGGKATSEALVTRVREVLDAPRKAEGPS